MINKIIKKIYNLNISISRFYYCISPITTFYYFILPIILLIHFYLTNDFILCDDGNVPNESNCWGAESTNNTVNSTFYPQYETSTYNSTWRWEEGNYGVDNGPVQYEPYRPGLQYTTEGYRYEMDGQVHYCDGCPNHSNYANNTVQSTQLGLIEPTRSEVLGKGYYQGSGWGHHNVYTTKYRSTRSSIWNKIKDDFRKTTSNAHKDRIVSHNKSSNLMKDVRKSRILRDVSKMEHTNTFNQTRPYKVRRFD